MKRIGLIFIILVLISTAMYFLLSFFLNAKDKTIHIAIAGPMTGKGKEKGIEMLQGIQIGIDEYKKRGKLKDIRLQLDIFNDKNKSTAIRIASQIADEKKVLMVIGHYDSNHSIAAGSIYKKNGIPAITASASAEEITSDNEWYFRVIPDNTFILNFMQQYMKKELQTESVSIYHDKNEYTSAVMNKIEKEFERLGIVVNNKWEYDREDSDVQKEIDKIIGIALSVVDPGKILLAAEEVYGTQIVGYTRYPGTDLTVIAPPAFSTAAFISEINTMPLEKKSPGFYTDGLYAVVPFLSYLEDKPEVVHFRTEYIKRFHKEPSWIAACYYDAIRIALEGIERGEVQFENIREDRQKVRDAIARFNNYDVAFKGITGDIWFDNHLNANGQSLYVGFWHNHVFIPAYTQYRKVEPNLFYDKLNEYGISKFIKISDQMMMKQKVVYIGIDINEIKSIRVDQGIFLADFYLWFRFEDPFDPSRIGFLNFAKPISLGSPVFSETTNNVKTVVYRLTGEFQFDPVQTKNYPFDRHHLHIRLRHLDMPRMQLIFVPDVYGLDLSNANKKNLSTTEWDVTSILYPQYTMNFLIGANQYFPYSVHDMEIEIQRKHTILLLLKSVVPILLMAVLLFMVYVIPFDGIVVKLVIAIPILLVTGIFNYMHYSHHIIRNALFIFYAAGGIAIVSSIGFFWLNKQGQISQLSFLTRISQFIYGLIMIVFIVYISSSFIFFIG